MFQFRWQAGFAHFAKALNLPNRKYRKQARKDGYSDALFPAIALNPRAAVIATLYSAVPALIVAYGFYFLAPGFLN